MPGEFSGKRVLVTQAGDYMGPASVEAFRREGADVIAHDGVLPDSASADALVRDAGAIDILIANHAAANEVGTKVADMADDDWARMFDVMVHPLHWLVRAVTPQMTERRTGKIIVFGSATALRGVPNLCGYSAARGAQAAYVRAVGVELARHNVQINLIAQNYVESEVYYPPQVTETPKFQDHMRRNVPINRLAAAEEDMALAMFLASDRSDFFVGQVIPFAGGWVS